MSTLIERIIRPDVAELSAAEARALLRWGFDDDDCERMSALVGLANERDLTESETAELEEYRRVGLLLDVMHAKARLSLQRCGEQ